jgi:hypothetical protein
MGKINIDDIKLTDKQIYAKCNSWTLNNLRNAWQNIEYQKNFKVGQVLVKKLEVWDHNTDTKSVQLEKNNAGAVQKYVVCNKIDDVIIVCRKFKIDGEIGKQIEILANASFGNVMYEEDPDEADAILLEYDYDPTEQVAIVGKARQKMNRSNGHKKLSSEIRKKVPKKKQQWGYDRLDNDDVAEYLKKQKKREFWILDDEEKKFTVSITSIKKVGQYSEPIVTFVDATGDEYKIEVRYIVDGLSYWSDKKWVVFSKEPMNKEEAIAKIKAEEDK